MLGVYIHIPFCSNICSYCDFAKVYYNSKYINNYLDKLEIEIKERYKNEVVDTIYIGGGTPSSLSYLELKRLLDIIKVFKVKDDFEYTIESNVESLDIDKIKLLKDYGINRISLGVQSFDGKCLKILGRKHSKEEVFKCIKEIKSCGLTNINIDFMYAPELLSIHLNKAGKLLLG